jgi:ABC-type transport system involved in multi-copper enzyme maturation permease subunit
VKIEGRRVRAIFIKEIREIRRNRSVLLAMSVLPLVFIVQPLIAILGLSARAASGLSQEHVLLYLLGIPILVPPVIAATAIAGERQQGTLEPVLTTPIRREELLLAKGLAGLIPSIAIALAVDVLFLLVVAVFAQPGIASAMVNGPDLVAQLVFMPLLAAWSVWVGLAVSTRTSDLRVAQQLALLVNVPVVFLVAAVAFGVLSPSPRLGVGLAALLIVLDTTGWRIAARLFDRERLISGTTA